MNEPFQLVTNCAFKGKDYLVQMCVFSSKRLELTVTDKLMAEDWQCEYDASYIETLTHKTGNFKNFEVFVMMLKSGLLKTSDCITLDLLTVQDLEELRNKKILNANTGSRIFSSLESSNKRYLIITYSVEFDRIHYPLPLDYCGPPDPVILQTNIRRLEAEVQRLKQKSSASLSRSDFSETKKLKDKIDRLIEDNSFLSDEVRRLNKLLAKTAKPIKSNQVLQNTLKRLEEQVMQEKNHFHHTIWKLKEENKQLKLQIEDYKTKEKSLKLRLKNATKNMNMKIDRKSGGDFLNTEQFLDGKRNIRGERAEIQLTCRGISSWNGGTVMAKPNENKKSVKRSVIKARSSSSESGIDRSEKLDSMEMKAMKVERNPTKLLSRKGSGDRSRNSSQERRTNVQIEATGAVSRKSRLSGVRRDSSNCSEIRTARRSRESSLSSRGSRGSSKHSRDTQFSSRGSNGKIYKSSKIVYPDHDELKFSVSDLETRIHALQKILSEGLNF